VADDALALLDLLAGEVSLKVLLIQAIQRLDADIHLLVADDALALLDLLAGEVSLKVLLIQAILIGDAIVLLHLGNYLVEPLDFRIFRLHIIDRRFL